MKKLTILFAFVVIFASCEKKQISSRDVALGDTITTNSGLKYIFLKKGNGRNIEIGSKVKVYTDLYLNDADTTIWRTANDKDSVFTFIHRKTSLIKGFTELFDYIIEGDEVIAILPDSLAYGEKGRGTVPPKATLIYKPLIVKYVSEPKETLSDTLIAIAKKDKVDAAIAFYEKATNGELDTNYHSSLDDVSEIVYQLNRDSSFVELASFSKYFANKSTDADQIQTFLAFQAIGLENQGKVKEALAVVEPLSKEDLNKEYWEGFVKKLKDKLKK